MPLTRRTDRRTDRRTNFSQNFRRAGPDTHEKINPGRRDLSTVKFSASYDAWRPKKRRKTETTNSEKMQTLYGRLPLKHGSVRPQTLGKRVSDNPRHFIFR